MFVCVMCVCVCERLEKDFAEKNLKKIRSDTGLHDPQNEKSEKSMTVTPHSLC